MAKECRRTVLPNAALSILLENKEIDYNFDSITVYYSFFSVDIFVENTEELIRIVKGIKNGALIGFRRTTEKMSDEKNELPHVGIDWGALGGDAAIVTIWDGKEWELHKLSPKES